ncbi:hypothetical protein QE429_000040 [Bacillus sp. SORGH_AS 510]|uniref:hypothetical protein n=1 Tax=Bacillus sp. SORGH_AS_0510 TaxID=3041771 RepID=UPI00277EE9FE|nr:hypothetical protein [Bacillus sp. SORGH_AS_0510]MDQ1143213.1 hypothetical protein [Bacillus sp. SORGH_AS_0510]
MNKKVIIFPLLAFAIVASSILVYWYYFSKPTAFPQNDQLIEKIHSVFPETSPNIIQDSIAIDERHRFVPFISKEGKYGVSYWQWEQHKWNVVSISTTGDIHVWKIDNNDPSTFYFLWNFHPDDQVNQLKLYLIRDRGYHGANRELWYEPRIQMEKLVEQKKSYGVLKMPAEWASSMNALLQVGSTEPTGLFNNGIIPNAGMYFGYIPYNKSGKEARTMNSVNGSSFQMGNFDHEYVRQLSESEIE